MLNFLYHSLQRSSLWSPRDFTEDTFVHEILAPILSPFFNNKLLICGWSTDELDASIHRKRKFDPSLQRGRVPDFTVSTSAKNKKQHLLVAEVKSPKHSSKALPDDLVKLGNEMKDSLDKMLDDGIDARDMVICGLHVQGLRCSLFTMDLKYDGVYRMILLDRFYLPRDHYDFILFQKAAEVLMQAKLIVIRSSELCVKILRTLWSAGDKAVPEGSRTPPSKKMARPSYHTPLKVPL